MVSFREAARMLDEEIEALPEEIFQGLNGGVNFLPETKKDGSGLCVMGLYHHNAMGRYVELYYGSFCAVYPDADEEEFRKVLRKTLHHELTHHLEGLAGDRSLEKWDDRHRAEIIARRDGGPTDSPLFVGGYTGPGENSVLRRRRYPAGGHGGRGPEK
ncbi:MAG: metallopeptidase family protein [Eubacteriales bacterium]|nr:metallopeptidase family protein [Eubacteriales bacterium]